jgi:hypothetical protein
VTTGPGPPAGRRIIACSWAATALFALLSGAGAIWEGAAWAATTVALGLFAVSLAVWAWAMLVAVARSAAGDDLAVGSLFLAQGAVDRRARAHLWGSLGVSVAVAVAVASRQPFATLVPMLPAGFVGLWGARHGTYPRRRDATGHRSLRPQRRRAQARAANPPGGRPRARDRH